MLELNLGGQVLVRKGSVGDGWARERERENGELCSRQRRECVLRRRAM